MTQFSDWTGYVTMTTGSPPRPLLQQAIDRFEGLGTAVDLGCGAGNETIALLQHGSRVHAVDSNETAIRTVTSRADGLTGLSTECTDLWKATLPAADLVYAGFSLFFVPPARYSEAWARVASAVRPGGRFAGQFLGTRDTWAVLPEITAHEEYAVRELLGDWVIESFDEVEHDGRAMSGPKHWHHYDVIAARPR
jgi:trans-aconitate methyltransferase